MILIGTLDAWSNQQASHRRNFLGPLKLGDIEIQNATVTICDSSTAETTPVLLSPLRQTTQNIYASLECVISKNIQQCTIHHMSCAEAITGFSIRDMEGDLYHTGDSMRVKFFANTNKLLQSCGTH